MYQDELDEPLENRRIRRCETYATDWRVKRNTRLYAFDPLPPEERVQALNAADFIENSSSPDEVRLYLQRALAIPHRGMLWARQKGLSESEIAVHFVTDFETVRQRQIDTDRLNALNEVQSNLDRWTSSEDSPLRSLFIPNDDDDQTDDNVMHLN